MRRSTAAAGRERLQTERWPGGRLGRGCRAQVVLIAVWLLAEPMWSLVTWGWGTSPSPSWLELTQPFRLAFMPYLRPGTEALPTQATFLDATVALATALAILSNLGPTLGKACLSVGVSGFPSSLEAIRSCPSLIPMP